MREAECPSCRKAAAEAHFRVNPTLEEAVSAWKIARCEFSHPFSITWIPTCPLRSSVLRLSREERPAVNNGPNSNDDQTPRRFQTPVRNGRKRRHIEVSPDSDVVCVAGPSNPRESSENVDSSPLRAKSARKASQRRTSLEPSSDPREEELQRERLRASCLPGFSLLVGFS